jgi:3-phosphoshikimate 1-carboxyvinyltransferase
LPFSLSGKLTERDYRIGGGVSSQYLSGLLMGLPLLPFDSKITVMGELQSAGYVEMTLRSLSRFGVQVRRRGPVFEIPGGRPYESPGALTVEGDWSNAAFFFVLGALLEEGVTVKGLQRDSLQGDRAVLSILEKMGAQVLWSKEGIRVKKGTLRGIEIDLKDVPDLAPALAIAGAMAEGKTTFVGAGRLRVKESDRIRSVCAMIRDLGGRAEEQQEGFTVYGGLSGGTVFGAGDHRIVMASAVASAVCPVTIKGAEAVSKSYPGFFEDLSSLGGECSFEE